MDSQNKPMSKWQLAALCALLSQYRPDGGGAVAEVFAEYDTAIYWFTDSWRRRWGEPKSDNNENPPKIRIMEW